MTIISRGRTLGEVSWPLDVVSATGRGWHVLDEGEVLSDDGVHRLLRRGERWQAFRSVGSADWEPLDFDHLGSLAGALDTFDLAVA